MVINRRLQRADVINRNRCVIRTGENGQVETDLGKIKRGQRIIVVNCLIIVYNLVVGKIMVGNGKLVGMVMNYILLWQTQYFVGNNRAVLSEDL